MVRKIIINLMKYKKTWFFYNKAKQIIFLLRRRRYSIRKAIDNGKYDSAVLLHIFSISLFSVVFPILLSLLMQLTEPSSSAFFKEHGLLLDSAGNYGTLLGVVTSVSGVFIGLYFSSLTAVSGIIYAQVSDQVRRVLINDRMSNVYLKYLASFTVWGVLQLSLNCLGFKVNPISIILIFLGASLGTLSFIPLGKRVFELFDPSKLSSLIIEKINSSVNSVSVLGQFWKEPNFQNYENYIASKNVNVLNQLVGIIEKNPSLNGRNYVGVSQGIVLFLISYNFRKNKIPTESKWFSDSYIFNKFYFTPSYLMDISLGSAICYQPEVKKNYHWLEVECFEIVLNCLRINMENNCYSEVINSVGTIGKYILTISENGDVEFSIGLFERTAECFYAYIEKINLLEEQREFMAIFNALESLAILPIQIILSFKKYLNSLKLEEIDGFISSLDWYGEGEIYGRKWSIDGLRFLEETKSKIIFEKLTEGEVITTNNQIAKELSKIEVLTAYACVGNILNKLFSFYDRYFNSLCEKHKSVLSCMVFLRREEFMSKLAAHAQSMQDSLKGAVDEPHDILKDIGSYLEEQSKCKINMLLSMSDHQLNHNLDGIPDYSGYYTHWICIELFSKLVSNELDCVRKLFNLVFIKCFEQFTRLHSDRELLDFNSYNKIKYSVPPLMNLIELSGIGMLLAEYFESDEMSKIIHSTWDDYLKEERNFDFIFSLGKIISEDRYTINNYQVIFDWGREVGNLMRCIEKKAVYTKYSIIPTNFYNHISSSVRVFAEQEQCDYYCFTDFFYALYIIKNNSVNRERCADKSLRLLDDIKKNEAAYKKFLENGGF